FPPRRARWRAVRKPHVAALGGRRAARPLREPRLHLLAVYPDRHGAGHPHRGGPQRLFRLGGGLDRLLQHRLRSAALLRARRPGPLLGYEVAAPGSRPELATPSKTNWTASAASRMPTTRVTTESPVSPRTRWMGIATRSESQAIRRVASNAARTTRKSSS